MPLLFILLVLLTCPCSVNLIILFIIIIVYFIIVAKTLHAESQCDEFIEWVGCLSVRLSISLPSSLSAEQCALWRVACGVCRVCVRPSASPPVCAFPCCHCIVAWNKLMFFSPLSLSLSLSFWVFFLRLLPQCNWDITSVSLFMCMCIQIPIPEPQFGTVGFSLTAVSPPPWSPL